MAFPPLPPHPFYFVILGTNVQHCSAFELAGVQNQALGSLEKFTMCWSSVDHPQATSFWAMPPWRPNVPSASQVLHFTTRMGFLQAARKKTKALSCVLALRVGESSVGFPAHNYRIGDISPNVLERPSNTHGKLIAPDRGLQKTDVPGWIVGTSVWDQSAPCNVYMENWTSGWDHKPSHVSTLMLA